MIVIDSDFNRKIDNSNYNDVYNKIIEYLKSIIIDEKILSDMLDQNDKIIIQETLGKEYSIKLPNGLNRKLKFPSSSSAFKTNMVIGVNKNVLGISPGIVLRPNYDIHQLIHELLHAISSTQINRFNEDGVVYTKCGTRIDYFDRNLNNYNSINNLSSNGLNEGITEFLTSLITNNYYGNYPPMVVIARLLMYSNNKLLNAYFSKDLNELEMFYSDLEDKQSIINRDDLCRLNSNEIEDEEFLNIISGALDYNKAYNKEIDSNYYKEIVNYLDNYYMLDTGSWDDLIQKNKKIKIS